MIVYVEQVVIDNLVINYLLLFLVGKLLATKAKFISLALGSFVGTVFALLFPFFSVGGVLLVVLKIFVGAVIITISFEYKNVKKFLLLLSCFIFLTAMMGGVIFALLLAMNPNLKMENGTFVYTSQIPIGLYVLIVAVISKLLYDAYMVSLKKQKLKQFEYDMTIFNQTKSLGVKVFLDTGNLLVDKLSGKPIIVVNYKIFQKLFNIKTSDFLLGKYSVPNSRYVTMTSAIKQMKMLVFEVDCVTIKTLEKEKKIDKAMLGLAKANFAVSLGCDAIMGGQVLDE